MRNHKGGGVLGNVDIDLWNANLNISSDLYAL